jgi:hypothetical protein
MTPELAKALREAGLWEQVLLDNARTASQWRRAVNDEREACALLCDWNPNTTPDELARAIRARAKAG